MYTTDLKCARKKGPDYVKYEDIAIGDVAIFDFWDDSPEKYSEVISIFKKEGQVCVQVDAKWQGLKPYTTIEHVVKK